MRLPLPFLSRRFQPRPLPAPLLLMLAYGGFIVVGTAFLMLPMSTTRTTTWLDAFFTATSAVTVTGLVTVDTGATYTHVGEGAIMVLMQFGGLGLMASAVLVLTALGIPIGLTQRIVLREELNQPSIGDLMRISKLIFVFALILEAVAAGLLATVFVPEFGWAEGLWQATFHSISAFNNAGFGLFPDSLSRWVGNPVVNIVVPLLFIFSGLGFIVLADLIEARGWRKLSVHSKLMIVGTGALIGVSWPLVAALEWTNPGTLGPLGFGEKIAASWFQAVTPRTAGFNTVDIPSLHPSTALLMMLLMAIGGGSSSTAGGIKVTTFIVLLLATVAFFKRRLTLHVFGRSLGTTEVMKVLALSVTAALLVMFSIFLLSIGWQGDILDLAFEVVSAFGTVGLSRGATGDLNDFGKALICVVMFAGRVGPLTFGFFLATRRKGKVEYPTGHVYLG